MSETYDFSGWATRTNLKCSDGRVIMPDAFKHNDGQTVPLVWNHQHNDPMNVLGHAMLENRDKGVYAYCKFNDTESGRNARTLVQHGDVCALSIYANQLKQNGSNVAHGTIREVSLVLAGANPGAFIDTIMQHSDGSDEEAIIYTGESIALSHSENETNMEEKKMAENIQVNEDEETVQDVFNTLTDKQKQVVYAIIGQALEDNNNDDEEDPEVKHNVFESDEGEVLAHSEMLDEILKDGKRYGSLRESFIQHSETASNTYGITNIDYLFPDEKNVTDKPLFISREMDWVRVVMDGVHHTPFSRIKSIFADITEDEARAKGYIKGKLKKEEVFSLLKRTTTPTTVYKKQKMDRDDVIDITDFDVVAWLKTEMRMMLDEELARAFLIGDDRLSSSDDKINEANIRPIAKDTSLYTIQKTTPMSGANVDYSDFIDAAVRARKDYRGSGNPTMFTTEGALIEMMLLKDDMGHRLYKTEAELAAALRVSKIVSVPVMEGTDYDAIIVNLRDYNVGADKGGSVNMFDDFDIDYNAQKYLIETRCSGALTVPYSAIVFSHEESGAQ